MRQRQSSLQDSKRHSVPQIFLDKLAAKYDKVQNEYKTYKDSNWRDDYDDLLETDDTRVLLKAVE